MRLASIIWTFVIVLTVFACSIVEVKGQRGSKITVAEQSFNELTRDQRKAIVPFLRRYLRALNSRDKRELFFLVRNRYVSGMTQSEVIRAIKVESTGKVLQLVVSGIEADAAKGEELGSAESGTTFILKGCTDVADKRGNTFSQFVIYTLLFVDNNWYFVAGGATSEASANCENLRE